MCFLEKKWTCKKNYIECDDTQKSKKKRLKTSMFSKRQKVKFNEKHE